MSDAYLTAIANAEPYPYWLDDVDEPDSNATLVFNESCDLVIIGGGYTGLWTAIGAKERQPSRDVVLIEAETIGFGASGRNGGFMDASLTHGIANGNDRFPQELAVLERLGRENLDLIEDRIKRYEIDCDFERTGEIDVATDPKLLEELQEIYDLAKSFGHDVELLDQDAMQAQVHSPTYHGGVWHKAGIALVDPARLAWGLKAAAESLGVRIYEHTKATDLQRDGAGVKVITPLGEVRAAKAALATNAFPPLLRSLKHYMVPVWDYAMCTEPLSPSQLDSIGWKGRQGLSDTNNQFHYYRLTEDNRILWGGYDAIYFFNSKTSTDLERRPETHALLSQHFFETFPQLEGLEFSHVWGGAIDTCTRFCPFWGRAMGGRVGYVIGFTGLGVASTRFGAETMLDLLDGVRSVATQTEFVRQKPLPFPPEPFRFAGIQLTRWSLDRADKRGGQRNGWLKLLDRMGLGFDS